MTDDRLRIDKWLCFARFYKSRTMAAGLVEAGEVTVNDATISKAAHVLKPGDVVTFRTGRRWRRVKVLGLAERRGPAVEAQTLYEELEPPVVAAW